MHLAFPWALLGLFLPLLPGVRPPLRRLVLLLLVLAASGPSLPLAPARTVVLLDYSPSARAAVWARAARLEVPPPATFLAFAEAVQEVPTPAARRTDLGDGTDLAAALEAALARGADRIVLVSDGLSQTPVVPPPVPVYALAVPPSPHAGLAGVLLPPYPAEGETVEVRAVVEATAPTEVTVTFARGGEQTRVTRRVPAGRSSIPYRFTLEGATPLTVTLTSPLGTDQVRAELRPSGTPEVWVLGDEAAARLLEAQAFRVRRLEALPLPIRADAVVIGRAARAFTPVELAALERFLKEGGALLFSATPEGLFFGGWERTPLADEIPVRPAGQTGVALVLVLDVSGSMADGNPSKLGLAVAGALSLVETARPEDRLGIVTFSSGPRWLFPPRPMTARGKREAKALLERLRPGGSTRMLEAYRQAVAALEAVELEAKQILVLTDGQVEEDPAALVALAEAARAQGIRTNSVALGRDADRALLARMSRVGEGRFWDVPTPEDLPRLFLEEAERTFGREALEGRFPVRLAEHPVTQGLATPPPARVLLPTVAQPWARVVLDSAGEPILALGERGLGKVAALTTDLSRSWTDWPEAPRFLGQLLRWLTRTPARPRYSVSREAGGVRVVVQGRFERAPKLRYGGEERPMPPIAPLTFEAVLPPEARGEAVVLAEGQVLFRVPLPEPSEWPLTDGRATLQRLATASQGALLADLQELPPAPRRPVPLTEPLLGLALAFLLLERYLIWRARRA